ncbi:hypothetical protein NP493_628g00012 [Ridgeia piscesae]|uniref:VWFD domain-containing protein n=1 Tax=Ridgeia piscesae TaxID=27915 RepID=A0AAD9KT20_RIDPI|nr:hypothetical protein NP493_628g00012 [Ridgeia piscesae]
MPPTSPTYLADAAKDFADASKIFRRGFQGFHRRLLRGYFKRFATSVNTRESMNNAVAYQADGGPFTTRNQCPGGGYCAADDDCAQDLTLSPGPTRPTFICPNPCPPGQIRKPDSGDKKTCDCYDPSPPVTHPHRLVCFGWSDPHYETFDGAGIDFQGVGRYAMSEYINSNLECEVKILRVKTSFGIVVQYDGIMWASVSIPGVYRNCVEGLCGNADGNSRNDYITKPGVYVGGQPLNRRFWSLGNSWRVVEPLNPEVDITPIRELQDRLDRRMKRTFFYQATETARVTFSGVQWPLHSTKCTSWVAISKHGIIGPFWFEDENGQSVMVNIERYLVLLRKFWAALGRRKGITGLKLQRFDLVLKLRWCSLVLRLQRFSVVLKLQRFSVVLKLQRFSVVLKLQRFSVVLNLQRFSVVLKLQRFSVVLKLQRFSVVLKLQRFSVVLNLQRFSVVLKLRVLSGTETPAVLSGTETPAVLSGTETPAVLSGTPAFSVVLKLQRFSVVLNLQRSQWY